MTQQGTTPIDLRAKSNRIRTGTTKNGRPHALDGFFLTDPSDFRVHVALMQELAERGCPLGNDVVEGVRSLRAIPIGLDLNKADDEIFELSLCHHCGHDIYTGTLSVTVADAPYVFSTTSLTSRAKIEAGIDLVRHADRSTAVPWLAVEERGATRTDGTAITIRVATIVLREWGTW